MLASSGRLELGHLLRDDRALLLASDHHLEAVKVGHLRALDLLGLLLCPRRCFPLGVQVRLLGGGFDGADARVALDGQLEVGQRQPLEGDQLPGDVGVGTLNESLVVVRDVEDDGLLAFFFSSRRRHTRF